MKQPMSWYSKHTFKRFCAVLGALLALVVAFLAGAGWNHQRWHEQHTETLRKCEGILFEQGSTSHKITPEQLEKML